MAEQRRVQPQHILLQPRQLRQAERQAGIVGEEAQIAQMVGDALALQEQRAQPAARAGVEMRAALSAAIA